MRVERGTDPSPSRLLLLGGWLVLLSSGPVVIYLGLFWSSTPTRWFDLTLLAPQLTWAASLILLRTFSLQTIPLQFLAACLGLGLTYLLFVVTRQMHINVHNLQGWGGALDVALVAFIYLPAVLAVFVVLRSARRRLGLAPLFERAPKV